MVITATELKENLGKYLDMAKDEEILITKNGHEVAKLVSAKEDIVSIARSLVGILPKDLDFDALREERIMKKCGY